MDDAAVVVIVLQGALHKAADAAVSANQETTGTLIGIDFSKGYPNLQLDNGVSAPASDLLRIKQGK